MGLRRGWIPVWRKLFFREGWLSPSRRDQANNGYAWLYLIALAQHEPYEQAGTRLGRGEFVISSRSLASRMGWSQSRSVRFLERLTQESMIDSLRDSPNGRVYRVVNYERYAITDVGERLRERVASDSPSGSRATHERLKKKNEEQRIQHGGGGEQLGFVALDPRHQAAIKGLYGWHDREGTDERVWGTVTDTGERRRLLEVAVIRLQGEELEYNGRLFRRILQTVIGEGAAEEAEARSFDPDRADRLYDEMKETYG